MNAGPVCPACGERERLGGTPREGDIEIRCEVCGSTWLRGSPRCRACGGEESVSRPQLMTRHPRGTLLSVVGRREVLLCPRCDAAVLGSGQASGPPVPEGYVSRFLSGAQPERAPAAPRLQGESQRSERRAAAPGRKRPRPAPPPTASAPELPTVRQGIERFLGVHPEADSLAMLLLGQQLGPSSRLHQLDDATAHRLAAWARSTWPDAATRSGAISAIHAAAAYWVRQGWTRVDLAAHLP